MVRSFGAVLGVLREGVWNGDFVSEVLGLSNMQQGPEIH